MSAPDERTSLSLSLSLFSLSLSLSFSSLFVKDWRRCCSCDNKEEKKKKEIDRERDREEKIDKNKENKQRVRKLVKQTKATQLLSNGPVISNKNQHQEPELQSNDERKWYAGAGK